MTLDALVSAFISTQYREKGSVLLAFSGGGDSLALFHLLCGVRRRFPHFMFAAAHVDHNWRPTSGEEAKNLEALAHQHQVPFHLHVLEGEPLASNAEDDARKRRHRFFKELCAVHGYQGVILAHHGDDQAETVLKRLFEGASLAALTAMHEVTAIDEVVYWRPLLGVTKKEICAYLFDHKLVPIEDVTNSDERYLRARLRKTVLPGLAASFGKEITRPLCAIASEAQQCKHFIDSCLEPFLAHIESNEEGLTLDISSLPPLHPYLAEQLLRRLASRLNITFSRQQISKAAKIFIEDTSPATFTTATARLYIHRRRISICLRMKHLLE